jgi:hypothetical protein
MLCFLLLSLQMAARNAILQKDRGERLGDRLLIICAVKFLALTHDLDFYYRPSQFLENCMLSDTEIKFDDSIKARYNKTIEFTEPAYKKSKPSTLFLAPWSSIDHLSQHFGKRHVFRTYFDKLQMMVTPKVLLPKLEIPPNTVSVAVHVRKGEGYDEPLSSVQIYKKITAEMKSKDRPADHSWPSKFPPEQYYIDQIHLLEDLLANKKITFFIFSDSLNPQDLTARIAKHCAKENASFINASSSRSDSPLIDMYKMSACDCLIRAESSFSMVSQIMGNHKLVFSPQSCEWRKNILYVTRVKLVLFNSKANEAMEYILERCDKTMLKQQVAALFS